MHIRTTSKWALALAVVASLSHAADPSGLWKPFVATYKVHSGMVADRTAPTNAERFLTISVEGKPAKEIFDAIGPDLKTTCGGDNGDRERSKKGTSCIYTDADKHTKDGPYRCWIGVNLKTGDTIQTVAC